MPKPLHVVFDASPLITACKFTFKRTPIVDILTPLCTIYIASSVEEEVAISGARYPDGVIAGERIAHGEIAVVPNHTRRMDFGI